MMTRSGAQGRSGGAGGGGCPVGDEEETKSTGSADSAGD